MRQIEKKMYLCILKKSYGKVYSTNKKSYGKVYSNTKKSPIKVLNTH